MSRKPASVGGAGETYRGPLHEAVEPAPETPASLLPSRQVWFGRDDDGALFIYPSRPKWTDGGAFEPAHPEQIAVLALEEWFQHLQGGQCQPFVANGPRIDCKRETTA